MQGKQISKGLKEELHNQSWTRGLWRMQTVDEMASFVELWDAVQEVQLPEEQDKITWRWTTDGVYSVKSAYNLQFQGSFSTFRSDNIWKAEIFCLAAGAVQDFDS